MALKTKLISSSFKVYNASAGSGKTFTLVKEYLKVLLTNKDIFTFQKILAITFTNKAAAEMKERVLSSLDDFSDGKETDLLNKLIEETSIDREIIKIRSQRILEAILNNYSAFAITTIDSFTYKIVKSFAYDLNLPLNFEVELDSTETLNKSVDLLLSKIGTEKKLTNLLIDFALSKVDDDKSWDISRELNKIAKALLNEDDIPHFQKLSNKTIDDFKELKSKLIKENKQLELDLRELGRDFLEKLSSANLEPTDFTGSTIPNFFSDLNRQSFKINFSARAKTIEKAIENRKYYNKTTPPDIVNKIELLESYFIQQFQKAKIIYSRYVLNSSLLKNITPVAVLNYINQEVNEIKEENNILLNAEFNQLIYEKIKEQPAPFIYERLGQRFQYYFIDEMQDTSVLQWLNLIPLISNALAQEDSSLMLVGDAKQAIYRWRGGKAEEFINMYSNKENPFSIKKEVANLGTNYRSYSEIINFNNSFFQHVSNYFQNPVYKELYKIGNRQQENDKKGGFVGIQFFESNRKKEDNDKQYEALVYEKINELKESFSLGEICIIVRKKKEGVMLANYLSNKEIPVISSESLLLETNEKVGFLINGLKLVNNQNDLKTLFEFLYTVHQQLDIKEDLHDFISSNIHKSLDEIFNSFKSFNILLNLDDLLQLPLYEKVELLIRSFGLIKTSDAYVQFFLDEVLEQQRKGESLIDFLDYWEIKKDKLSIAAQENNDAVRIMTIHKSKGLEFPVVLFPSNLDIYFTQEPTIWLDDLPNDIGFDEFYLNYSKSKTPLISKKAEELHHEIQENLELDTFNLLYVAFTRAKEQLHVITEIKKRSNQINENFTSGILVHFLKQQNIWSEDVNYYTFGNPFRQSKVPETKQSSYELNQFISSNWKNHNLTLLASDSQLWETKQGDAIDYGNLLHAIMQEIKYTSDATSVLKRLKNSGLLSSEELEIISKQVNDIINHKDITHYFSNTVQVINEREIIGKNKEIIIPDRLIFTSKNEVVLIDYKTGAETKKHHLQLENYKKILQETNIKVQKMLLIYINKNIKIVEV